MIPHGVPMTVRMFLSVLKYELIDWITGKPPRRY